MNHLFPRFHLRPPRGYINDPNGPVLIDDTMHLYFQSRPTTDTDAPVQWGHATTNDFVRWNLHRPAMTPHPAGPDRDGCFSGNTVETPEGVRAFYSGNVEGKRYQSTLTALSTDGGYTFGDAALAIPDPGVDERVIMFRDPFVWRDGDSWRMVVGSELEGEVAAVRQYRSPDLAQWTLEGNLVSAPRAIVNGVDTGAGWECPQVVSFDEKDIVLVSSWAHVSFAGAILAINLDSPQVVDGGSNLYAASVLRRSEYGPLMFGWLSEASDPSLWQERGWAGAISLPRVLSLGSDGQVLSDPVPALDTLRIDQENGEDFIASSSAFELRLPHVSGVTRIACGEREWIDVRLDVEENVLTVSRDNASVDSRAHRGVMSVADAFNPDRSADAIRVFVDGSIIEAFTSAGRVLSTRVYPTSPPPWKIETPGKAIFHHLSSARSRDMQHHTSRVDPRESVLALP